ncbi:MAG: hypothetical protein MJ193_01760 [Clostridia bacterium]|nr:hypothetical protein [Clostridia bacterium]
MKEFAKNYLEAYKGFSKIVKVLLCILWDLPTNLYRFSKSALKDSAVGMVVAVILAIFGGWILFVIDIVTLLVMDKIFWLDDFGVEEADKADDAKADAPAEDEKKDQE